MKSGVNFQKLSFAIVFVLAAVLISSGSAMSISLPKNPRSIQIIDRAVGWHPVTGQAVYARLYRNDKGSVVFEVLKEKVIARNDWESIYFKNLGNINVPEETILDIRTDIGQAYMRFQVLSEFYADADMYVIYNATTGKFTEH